MSALDATYEASAQSAEMDDPHSGVHEQLLEDSVPPAGTADSGSSAPEDGTAIAGSNDGFSIIDSQAGDSGLDTNAEEQPASGSIEGTAEHNWKDIFSASLLAGSVGFASANVLSHRSEMKGAFAEAKSIMFDKGQLSKDMLEGHTRNTQPEGLIGKASTFANKAARIASIGVKFLR